MQRREPGPVMNEAGKPPRKKLTLGARSAGTPGESCDLLEVLQAADLLQSDRFDQMVETLPPPDIKAPNKLDEARNILTYVQDNFGEDCTV